MLDTRSIMMPIYHRHVTLFDLLQAERFNDEWVVDRFVRYGEVLQEVNWWRRILDQSTHVRPLLIGRLFYIAL